MCVCVCVCVYHENMHKHIASIRMSIHNIYIHYTIYTYVYVTVHTIKPCVISGTILSYPVNLQLATRPHCLAHK